MTRATRRRPSPLAARPYIVIIANTRRTVWGRFTTHAEAEDAARRLREHGFDARVVAAKIETEAQP